MTTDFSYGNKAIDSSGPIKPSGKNQPLDPRTEVKIYADIETIPNPYVGMIITVLEDETNQNKMTDYKVLSLKANALGIANSVIDRVQKYSEYLGVSTGGSSSSGTGGAGLTEEQEERLNKIPEIETSINDINESLNTKANTSDIPTNTSELYNDSGFLTSIPSEYVTETEMNEAIANISSGGSVSQEDINTAVNNYLTEHPVSGGATTEQAAQIEANRVAIGDENSGLTKEVNDIKNTELQNLNTTIQEVNETLGDKTGLPSGDANVIASINRIDSKPLEPINYTLGSNVSKTIQRINSDMPNCIVSFISDDLYMADYTKKDWFKELGCAYTIPVVCSRINSDGYPTLEQVLELQNDYGYEIASHTFNHVQLDKQTDEVMEEELKSSFEFLNKNGLRCENFMIPYGAYNNKVLAVASKYYRSIRSSEEDYNSIGLDTTRIKSFWIDRYKTTDLEGQKARVDNAFENGLWLIFSMHTGTMGESEFTDMVKPLIEYVNSKNIPIMTVSKALDYFQNPIEVSSITSAGVRTRHFYINAKGEIISDKITLLSNKILEQENTIKVLTSKQNDIISRLTALEQNTGGAVYVQSVSIDNTPITVQINKSKKLTCTVLPSTATDKTVVWSGDNDLIATITSDGTITGNQLGTVNITVTTNDGNKTDTVSVEVVETHVSSGNFKTLTLDGSENWSEDTSFVNHGPTYDTSVFRMPTPAWCDGTAMSDFKYSRDFKEVNFTVVPGLSTSDMYSTYHDNAIIVRNDYIYVEIKNSLLSTTGVNGFKNYLNSNNISVDVRTKVYNKKYITLDGYSGLATVNFTNISNGVFHAYLKIDGKLNNFGATTSISEQLNWIDYDNRNFDKTVKDIFTYSGNNLFIGIDANKLSEFTIEALNQYLNENPIVIELTLK